MTKFKISKLKNNKIIKNLPVLGHLLLAGFLAVSFLYFMILYSIKNINIFVNIILFILLTVVLFIIFSERTRNYLKKDDIQKNINIFSWLSILFAGISIILTIVINFSQQHQTLIDIEQALIIENDLNQRHAKSILEDKEKEWFYWNEFSILNYKPNLNYILRYKNKECQIKYLKSINSMDIVNNTNKALINLGVEKMLILTTTQSEIYDKQFKELKGLIEKNASSTYNNLDYIFKNCTP